MIGLMVTSCFNDNYKTSDGVEFTFEEVGYFKTVSKQRLFTFNVKTSEYISCDSLSDEVVELLKKHAKERMNTEGSVTGVFYYFSPNFAPNITNSKDEINAENIAFDAYPSLVIWKWTNGNITCVSKEDLNKQ